MEMAGLLAAETDAMLVLVAAYRGELTAATGADDTYQAPVAAVAERTLKHAAARCTEMGAGYVHTYAIAGDPVTVLAGAVHDHQGDLLLVGSHGLSSLTGRLLGSVPSGVARTAGCDVLVVHTTTDRWRKLVSSRYRHSPSGHRRCVVVGVHDSERSMRAVDKAAAIAADACAELVLVGAYEDADRKVLAHATDALKGEGWMAGGAFGIETVLRDSEARARALGAGPIATVVSHGDAVSGLLEAADAHRADLLVLGNHQLTGAVGRLVGSPSAQVSRNTPTHVLLVN